MPRFNFRFHPVHHRIIEKPCPYEKGRETAPALFFSTYKKLCRLDIGTGIALMVRSPRAHDATADFP